MGRPKRPADNTPEACSAYVKERLTQLMTLGKKRLSGKELRDRMMLLAWWALLHNVPMPGELKIEVENERASLPHESAPQPAAPEVKSEVFGRL